MKLKRFFCLMAAAIAALWALRLVPDLPGDSRTYIERKYAGWSGVLHAWVYEGDGCGGRELGGWLKACAAAYERAHPGVYVEFEQVSADKILFLNSFSHKPDLIFFPPGLLDTPAGLTAFSCENLRGALEGLGGGYAVPVAMGGYALAVNPDAGDSLAIPADTAGSKYSAAAICLHADAEAAGEIEIEYELDLGLEAMAAVEPDAWSRFAGSQAGRLVISQRELWHLLQLRDAGKGPDWTIETPGEYVYTDRFLYAAIPAGDSDDAPARAALAAGLVQHMLADDMQKALAGYGAFPVTDIWAHAGGSALSQMEAHIRRGRLVAPSCFSGYWNAGFEDIVRDFTEASISQDEALRRLMLAGLDMEM